MPLIKLSRTNVSVATAAANIVQSAKRFSLLLGIRTHEQDYPIERAQCYWMIKGGHTENGLNPIFFEQRV